MRFPRPASTGALLTVALVVPGVVVAPSFTASRPEPHPVAPQTQELALSGVNAAALRTSERPDDLARAWRVLTDRSAAGAERAATRTPIVLTKPMATEQYRMLGVTWRGAPPSADGAVMVSARTRDGATWSDWFDIHTLVDTGTQPSPNGRFGTEPHWVGEADGVQVRVDAVGTAQPRQVKAELIEPGTSDADAEISRTSSGWTGSTATASTNAPPIVTRAQWGADESLRDKRLEQNRTAKVFFVHHTAGSNSYSRSESPAVVRGLYSYYVNSLNYGDMGYNFLVDKYGTIYEGRAGSIDAPVRAAATGGFNTDSMAIVAMGNFETAPASDAMVAGIARVAGYRLSRFHLNPFGHKTLKAEIGSSRYSEGRKVRFRVISGHRDAGYTACPGDNLYRRLPDIRRKAANAMGASLIEPRVSPQSFARGVQPDVAVRSRVSERQDWALTIRPLCGGGVVRRITGSASPTDPISTRWRGVDDSGARVPAGRYKVTLSSSGNGSRAWSYSETVTVGVGDDAAAPTTSSLPRRSGAYVPQRSQVLVSSTTGTGIGAPMLLGSGRRLDVKVLGRAGVPSTGVSAVALSVEAGCASSSTRVFVSPDSVSGVGARALSVERNHTGRSFVMVPVGPNGGIRFQNGSGVVALRASVVGYVTSAGSGGSLVPLRRVALGGASPVNLGSSPTTVQVAGRAGVPSDARAAVLSVRRGDSSKVGAIWAWPESGTKPDTASWRKATGIAAVSQMIVPLGSTGRVRLAADGAGPVSLEVAGYVSASADRAVHPVVPRSLLGNGAKVKDGRARTVSVRGRAGVPQQARAVVVSVTGTVDKRTGHLKVWPRGGAEPSKSDLVVPRRETSETLVVVRIGRHGDVRLRANGASVKANLTVVGWID